MQEHRYQVVSSCYYCVYNITTRRTPCFLIVSKILHPIFGGVETGSMYLEYIQGIQPNVPAHTTFIELYREIDSF